MDAHLATNQEHWNELVPIHVKSEFYDLDGFKRGRSTLLPIEREEVGEVARKSLLHLQCHFGMDTLSWARLGANVTGVDFSAPAIDFARGLSRELNLEARFICANLYDLPDALSGEFEIVFTSYGVLCWLPDLTGWARVIAHFLAPGGTFYIIDGHPMTNVFSYAADLTDLRVEQAYFSPRHEPERSEGDGSYADPTASVQHQVTYEWNHSLGEIITALTDAGLRIEFLHEFPLGFWPRFPSLTERGEDGLWRFKDPRQSIPLTYSVRARKR